MKYFALFLLVAVLTFASSTSSAVTIVSQKLKPVSYTCPFQVPSTLSWQCKEPHSNDPEYPIGFHCPSSNEILTPKIPIETACIGKKFAIIFALNRREQKPRIQLVQTGKFSRDGEWPDGDIEIPKDDVLWDKPRDAFIFTLPKNLSPTFYNVLVLTSGDYDIYASWPIFVCDCAVRKKTISSK